MTHDQLFQLCEDLQIQRLKKNLRGQISGFCPFHHNVNTPSWGIAGAQDHHPWHCYGCHKKGTLLSLVMNVKQCDKSSAMRFISRYGDYDAGSTQGFGRSMLITMRDDSEKQEPSQSAFDQFHPYLFQRDVVFEYFEKERCIKGMRSPLIRIPGYMPEQARLLFPWWDGSRFLGCTGAYIGPDKTVLASARSVAYFGLRKGDHLFSPYLRSREVQERASCVIVVEGEIDAYSIACAAIVHHLNPLPYVVALSNSSPSEDQVSILREIGLPLLPWLDNDNAGRNGEVILLAELGDDLPMLQVKRPTKLVKGVNVVKDANDVARHFNSEKICHVLTSVEYRRLV